MIKNKLKTIKYIYPNVIHSKTIWLELDKHFNKLDFDFYVLITAISMAVESRDLDGKK